MRYSCESNSSFGQSSFVAIGIEDPVFSGTSTFALQTAVPELNFQPVEGELHLKRYSSIVLVALALAGCGQPLASSPERGTDVARAAQLRQCELHRSEIEESANNGSIAAASTIQALGKPIPTPFDNIMNCVALDPRYATPKQSVSTPAQAPVATPEAGTPASSAEPDLAAICAPVAQIVRDELINNTLQARIDRVSNNSASDEDHLIVGCYAYMLSLQTQTQPAPQPSGPTQIPTESTPQPASQGTDLNLHTGPANELVVTCPPSSKTPGQEVPYGLEFSTGDFPQVPLTITQDGKEPRTIDIPDVHQGTQVELLDACGEPKLVVGQFIFDQNTGNGYVLRRTGQATPQATPDQNTQPGSGFDFGSIGRGAQKVLDWLKGLGNGSTENTPVPTTGSTNTPISTPTPTLSEADAATATTRAHFQGVHETIIAGLTPRIPSTATPENTPTVLPVATARLPYSGSVDVRSYNLVDFSISCDDGRNDIFTVYFPRGSNDTIVYTVGEQKETVQAPAGQDFLVPLCGQLIPIGHYQTDDSFVYNGGVRGLRYSTASQP